jgi:hypothetical protein
MMTNITSDINTLSHELNLAAAQSQINVVRHQLHECKACTPESRQLMEKLVSLVRHRNSLRTASESLQIERERGLA